MKLLATITVGRVLRDCENLSKEQLEDIEDRISNNAITEDELYSLGFKDVHYEGISWTERN
ncbi:MAG: hypothetical protein KAH32_09270 [Chlamydiia bacterium]|nr:hypothetical protein [Chlamydiia bacterium]